MKTSHRLLLLVIPLLALALVSLFWRGSTQRVHAPAPVSSGTPLAGDSGASGSPRSLGARVQAAPVAAIPNSSAPVVPPAVEANNAFAVFNSWAEKFQAATTPQERSGLAAQGEDLARTRRTEMIQLMQTDRKSVV